MTLLRLAAASVVLSSFACTPTVHVTRTEPPVHSLGAMRQLSVDVRNDASHTVPNAVATGLLLGELPVPLDVASQLRGDLIAELATVGVAACAGVPCGDGTLVGTLLESAVGSSVQRSGAVTTTFRLRARLVVTGKDGVSPVDVTYWERRSGNLINVAQIVQNATRALARSFGRSLQPRHVGVEIPLETGGALDQGVRLLTEGNAEGARAYFADLVTKQPTFAAAFYNLGAAYEALGALAYAAQSYRLAADAMPASRYREAAADAEGLVARQAAFAAQAQPAPVPVP